MLSMLVYVMTNIDLKIGFLFEFQCGNTLVRITNRHCRTDTFHMSKLKETFSRPHRMDHYR